MPCLIVERLALFELFPHEHPHLLRRLAEEQRSDGASHLQMFEEHLRRGFEIHCLGAAVHVSDVVEEAWRAAAAAHHHVLKLCHLMQHVALYAAESLLSRLVKYVSDGAVHACLDVPVKVVEPFPCVLRERFSHSGLAGTHVSQEYNGSAHFLRRVAGFFFSGVAFTISIHFSYVSSAALGCSSFGMR